MRQFYGDFVGMYRMVMLTYTNPMHILDLMMGFPNSQANGSHQPGMIVLPPCPFYFIIRFTSAAYFMFAIRIIVYIYIYQLYHVLGIYFTVFSACLSKIHVLHLHTPSCPRSFRYVLFIFRSEYLSNSPTGVAKSTPLRHNRMASVHIGCCEELTVPWCCRFMVGSDFQWGYHGATMGYSGNISGYYIVIYIYILTIVMG